MISQETIRIMNEMTELRAEWDRLQELERILLSMPEETLPIAIRKLLRVKDKV